MLEEKMKKIEETIAYLNTKKNIDPKVAIVLGSGLGGLINRMEIINEIPYSEIPNFPISTVKGHKGTLIFGRINNVDVVVLNGRFHFYEGYSLHDVTYPEYVFKGLGVKSIVLSNASGGMNPSFKVGDIMIIRDHINFLGTNPLIGPNNDSLGPRFPNMSEVYDRKLIRRAHEIANEANIHLQEGVYIGVTGPSFETPSEYKAYYILGADVVGMSTVPEAIVSHYLGMKVFALSVVTDLGIVGQLMDAKHEDVLMAAKEAEPKMTRIIHQLIPEMID